MLASGTTGTVATTSEALMQDFRAGEMIGSSPKYLTYMQLIATPVGAFARSAVEIRALSLVDLQASSP